MEAIEPKTIYLGIGGFILILMLVYVILWLIAEWGKRQLANEMIFEALYAEVTAELADLDDTPSTFDIIQSKILKIYSLKWRDEEKMNVLVDNFKRKQGREYCKRLIA